MEKIHTLLKEIHKCNKNNTDIAASFFTEKGYSKLKIKLKRP